MTHPRDAESGDRLAPFHEVRIGRDDPAEIRRSFEENGYLLFKGALNTQTVLRVRSDIAGVLQRQGVMREDSAEPRATPGASAVEVDMGPLYRLKSPWELMASRELQEAVDIAFGERVRVGRSIGFRYSMPTDAPYLTPPHQDHFYLPADSGNEEWGTDSPPSYQPVAKVVTAFDRPCIPADCVAIRSHMSNMLPHRALSGGRRNGLGARGTFTTGCYSSNRQTMPMSSQYQRTPSRMDMP